MKFRNTLILLVIAAGAFCFLRFYEATQPTTQEAEENSTYVIQTDRDNIDGITITNNESKIDLQKDSDNRWNMVEPVKDRADDLVVAQLLTTLEKLPKDSSVTPEAGKSDDRDYGLEKPNLTLELHGQDAPPAILFGKETPIEGQQYVRLANSNEVYVIADDLKDQIVKSPDDFRSHQLSDVPASEVVKADIDTPAGEVELERDHDHWQINKPIKARGDDAKISDLLAQIFNTKIDAFVPSEQAGNANAGFAEGPGSVTFAAEGVDKPLVLQFSKPTEKDAQKVYAKLSTRDAIFVMSGSAASILNTKPNDVRDSHLIRIDLDTVDRIHVTPATGPEILLARKGEDWTIKSLGDKPANSGDVRQMAENLQDQLVTFVSDVATNLAQYGLDHPQLEITFSSYASENTAETNAGEEPIETIMFGKIDGDNVYAKLNDEPFIVSVPKSILDNIYTDPLKWQDLAIYNLKPDDIEGLDVAAPGQATVSLVKDKGDWKPAKGDIPVNTVKIESIVNTLSTLRAVQWMGAAQPAQGMDSPAETITFTLADKTSNTVKIGGPWGDYWCASASGKDGVFLINKPDHDALTADVLFEAKPVLPMPSASTTGTQ
jgi:hypothetical protein